MRFKEYFGKAKEWLSSNNFEIVYKMLIAITAMCLVFSYALTRDYKKNNNEKTIKAYIKGEVVNPGVYEISDDGRIGDLINAAGGLTQDADSTWINLSERIIDEEVIVIPKKNYEKDSALVNINTATLSELDSLYGIGETLAQRIIDYREQYGSFKKIEYIMNVDGIGEELFEKIKNDIIV